MTLPTVAFVGMTHLGLVSATVVSSAGFSVLCVDGDAGLIGRLAAGELPVLEPGLEELLQENVERQTFSSEFEDLSQGEVVYIAPDVPTDDYGASDLSGIQKLVENVLPHLSPRAILVILCQVPPGFTRSINLDSARLYYQVETLVFGRAVERATQPERYIIGCADPSVPLPHTFDSVLGAFSCPILPMRYESAELAKISINMCLVASVSVANTMAEICENIDADWSEIAPALRLDRRIGAYSYLKPGLGFAGGNLERDLATVIRLGEEHKTDTGLVQAFIANSRHRRDWALEMLRSKVLADKPDPLLAVWGLAYKENTHSIKNSPSIATLDQIPEVRVALFDPVVKASAAKHPNSRERSSALAALDGGDALLIMTPWPEFKEIPATEIAAALSGTVVIDPYCVIEPSAARNADLLHLTLGGS